MMENYKAENRKQIKQNPASRRDFVQCFFIMDDGTQPGVF